MDHAKLIASEELLALVKEIRGELESLEHSDNDNDYDAGWKVGARDSLHKVNDLIHGRVKNLVGKG